MASCLYDCTANNYRGFSLPGIRVLVRENDGAIGIEMVPEGDDPDTSSRSLHAAFNVDDAEKLRDALAEAITRAKPKGAKHPSVR